MIEDAVTQHVAGKNDEAMRWIRADEEAPEELQTVLVVTADLEVTLGAIYQGGWLIDFADWDDGGVSPESVTHWQRLPEPPREAKPVVCKESQSEPAAE